MPQESIVLCERFLWGGGCFAVVNLFGLRASGSCLRVCPFRVKFVAGFSKVSFWSWFLFCFRSSVGRFLFSSKKHCPCQSRPLIKNFRGRW